MVRGQMLMFRWPMLVVLLLLPGIAANEIGQEPAPVPPAHEADFRVLVDEDRPARSVNGEPGYGPVRHSPDLQYLDLRERLHPLTRAPGLAMTIGFLPPEEAGLHHINLTFRIASAHHVWQFTTSDGRNYTGPAETLGPAVPVLGDTLALTIFADHETLQAKVLRLSWAWEVASGSAQGPGDVMPGSYHLPDGSMAPQQGSSEALQYRLLGPGQWFRLEAGQSYVDWWRQGIIQVQLRSHLLETDQQITIRPLGLDIAPGTFMLAPGDALPLSMWLGPPQGRPDNVTIEVWSELGALETVRLPVLSTEDAGVMGDLSVVAPMRALAVRVEGPGSLALQMPDNATWHFDVAPADGEDRSLSLYWLGPGAGAYAERLTFDADDTVRLVNLGGSTIEVLRLDAPLADRPSLLAPAGLILVGAVGLWLIIRR